jgi:hypothetical protein
MHDKRFCLIDIVSGAFVVADSVESLITNSFHSPDIKHEIEKSQITFNEWRKAIEDSLFLSDFGKMGVHNKALGFVVTTH